jgi:hypothetical protein
MHHIESWKNKKTRIIWTNNLEVVNIECIPKSCVKKKGYLGFYYY